MYKNYHASLIVTIFFSLLIYTHHAAAKDCYKKSPAFITLGDKYFRLDHVKTLSAAEKTRLDKLFDRIKGKWEGESTYTECSGPDRAPRKKSTNAAVVVKIKPGPNDNFLLAAKKSYGDNTTRYDGIEMPGDLSIFEFTFINDNQLVFAEKSVTKNENKSNRYVETRYGIKLKRNALVLAREYYSNGVFVAEEKWSLKQ